MTDEEKFRLQDPEEELTDDEKKGFFRPLPKTEKEVRVKDGKAQPITRFLGISMYEKNRDILLLILMPFLTAVINTTIYTFVTLHLWENSATFLFFIPIVTAIPIGLVIAETGPALIGGFLSAIFFFIFFVLFLASPALITPELGFENFLISGIMLSVGYIIFVVVAGLLGAVIGTIRREFL